MLIAAKEAGLAGPCSESSADHDINDNDLILALEPTAASVWCMKNTNINLQQNDVFIVADCGGGTIDCTVHEITSSGQSTPTQSIPQLCEAVPASGLSMGSTVIDIAFFKFLKDVFGQKRNLKMLKDVVQGMAISEAWERAKCAFEGHAADEGVISLPEYMISSDDPSEVGFDGSSTNDLIAAYNSKHGTLLEVDGSQLIIPTDVMNSFFAKAVNSTVQHVKSIITQLEESGVLIGADDRDAEDDNDASALTMALLNSKPPSRLTTIILVGNFAASVPLQRAFRTNFEPLGLRVIIPPDPGMCVARGAALLGALAPTQAPIQRMKNGYGIRLTRVAEWDDPDEVRVLVDGRWLVRKAIECFVDFGEVLDAGGEFEKTLYPLKKGQESIRFDVYAMTRPQVKYTSEDGAEFIGTLKVHGPPEELREGVRVKMNFGGANITVSAVSKSGTQQRVTIDFLSQNSQ
ncbi:Heat shock 70 kDa protein 12A [Blyttiomyces sp. JEL0837]|nr:Heat shock 70 kDa protein 12A [Blyttiomyces sp. JEL0837]